jgi:hypothetical protein
MFMIFDYVMLYVYGTINRALIYGTRTRIKFMHRNTIDCEVLTGTERNKRILIPRINLTYSGTITI